MSRFGRIAQGVAIALLAALGTGFAAADEPGRLPEIRDCADCPAMRVLPGGRFRIGSPPGEPGRTDDEGPQREVIISRPFAISEHEITRGAYLRFVRETHREIGSNCITDRRRPFEWLPDPETNMIDPGFEQGKDHPVVCVTWHDASAYAEWLSRRTGHHYRLPTEAEWEYAARGGTTAAYFWGDDKELGCAYMNGTDRTAKAKYPLAEHVGCNDGALNTAPVGHYLPNPFGLYDMTGNAGEWTQSCATPDYRGWQGSREPASVDCSKRIVRGGSWGTIPRQLRVAERMRYDPATRDDSIGIRLVRDVR